MSYNLRKCLKLYVSQTRKFSIPASYGQCFFLGACFYSYFNSLSSISSSMFKECFSGCIAIGSSLIRKKGKFAKMTTRCHWLSRVITRCLSLSLVVPLVVIRCHSLYHSLSLAVTRCITRLSFINDLKEPILFVLKNVNFNKNETEVLVR